MPKHCEIFGRNMIIDAKGENEYQKATCSIDVAFGQGDDVPYNSTISSKFPEFNNNEVVLFV